MFYSIINLSILNGTKQESRKMSVSLLIQTKRQEAKKIHHVQFSIKEAKWWQRLVDFERKPIRNQRETINQMIDQPTAFTTSIFHRFFFFSFSFFFALCEGYCILIAARFIDAITQNAMTLFICFSTMIKLSNCDHALKTKQFAHALWIRATRKRH